MSNNWENSVGHGKEKERTGRKVEQIKELWDYIRGIVNIEKRIFDWLIDVNFFWRTGYQAGRCFIGDKQNFGMHSELIRDREVIHDRELGSHETKVIQMNLLQPYMRWKWDKEDGKWS